MLIQMVRMVREQQPDVFLLCGDVYHTPQPSAAVQTMLTEALVRIHEARPEMVIVMTAGNHDSGTKHEIFRTPWKALNVYAIGQIEKDRPEEHIIEVPGKGYVVAIPYFNERNMPERLRMGAPAGTGDGSSGVGFIQSLLDEVWERNTEKLPVVMTAHTTVTGCDFRGHDHATDRVVGGIDAVDLEQMGCGYDYLALGHIHHEQFVRGGGHHVRYCGTPLPVSFDEDFTHSVSIVEIDRHGDRPQVATVEIDNPHPLVTLPTEGFAAWEKVKDLLARFPSDIPAYIRLNVEIDDFLPMDAQAEAALLTEDKQCRFCCINAKRRVESRARTKILSVQEFQAEEPIDIARRYAEDMGIDFDDEMKALFDEAVREMKNEE